MTELAILTMIYGPALAMALAALGLAVGVVLIIAKWRKTGAVRAGSDTGSDTGGGGGVIELVNKRETAKDILEQVPAGDLKEIVVLGLGKDGTLYTRSNALRRDILWMLESAKLNVVLVNEEESW